MINFDYKKFDFFLINKNNWKQQEEVFYGYKTVGDNGIWLHVYWEDNKLLIKGSHIQPYIFIYKDDNYWSISNNFYLLTLDLEDKNIKVTENEFFKNWNDGRFGFCIHCPIDETLYNEIKVNPNYSYIEIDDSKLNIIEFNSEVFTKPLEKSKSDLIEWYLKYCNFCKNLPNGSLYADFSGGFDSRILFSLYRNIDNVNINSSWQKGDEEEHYYDGLLCRLYLKRNMKHKYKIKSRDSGNYKNQNIEITPQMIEDKKQNLFLHYLFNYGVLPLKETEIVDTQSDDFKNIKPRNDTKIYQLSGIGMELHKWELGNCVEEINATTRRWMINKAIFNYYKMGKLTIYAFMDDDLLKVQGRNDNTFPLIMAGLTDTYDSEVPYYSRYEMHFVTPQDIQNALSIFKED